MKEFTSFQYLSGVHTPPSQKKPPRDFILSGGDFLRLKLSGVNFRGGGSRGVIAYERQI